MSLIIRRLGNKNFWHYSGSYEPYSASDLLIVFDGNYVKLRGDKGRIVFDRDGYLFSDVIVYDDASGGSAETFSTVIALEQRLIALGHPAFYEDGEIVIGNYISDDALNSLELGNDGLLFVPSTSTSPIEQPIENTYADITALLADQANQDTGFIQKVEDASDDPNVDSGRAYYEKLASSTATLADDYDLINPEQAAALDVSDIFTFTVQSVDTSVPSNAGGGKIRVQYLALDSKVDFIIFNKQFSKYLDGLVAAQDTYAETVNYSVTFYNTTQEVAVTFKNVDWEDLGAYVKMNAAYSNVDYTNFVANDIVKVVISSYNNNLDGGTP